MRTPFVAVALLLTSSALGCRHAAPSDASITQNDQTPGGTYDACAAFRPEGNPLTWLRAVDKQDKMEDVFKCAKAPAELPVGDAAGYGSLFASEGFVAGFQSYVGSVIWGGKVLVRHEDGTVTLNNKMVDAGPDARRYDAQVIAGTSTAATIATKRTARRRLWLRSSSTTSPSASATRFASSSKTAAARASTLAAP
jgi:hypothetical protein